MQKNVIKSVYGSYKVILTLVLFYILSTSLSAQPGYLYGNMGLGFSHYQLQDRGGAKAVTIKAETTNATAGFFFKQFNESGGWYPKWCGKTGETLSRKVNHMIADSARYCAEGCGWDNNMSVFIAHGSYYTFIVGKNSTGDNNMSILETSYAPDTIMIVTRAPSGTEVATGQPVTVTVTLKRAKNSQERVFVRWTKDAWVTSSFVEITSFDGSFIGNALIPAQVNAGTISFYVFTTNSANTPTSANADYLTLNIKNNNNLNYSYNVVTNNPYILISNATEILEHQENGKLINVKVRKTTFKASLTASNWAVTNLPAGVTKGAVTRLTDSTATIALSGNSSAEYGSDITNVTVTIQPAEFAVAPDAALTANTGVVLKNVTEVPGIYLHMLTSENFTHFLGEAKSYWINAELGQQSWSRSQIGYGKSNTDSTGWTWTDATWYENGEGNNKRVHAQITIPTVLGTGNFYYVIRAKDQPADPWHFGNTIEWTNTAVFAPVYKITVKPVVNTPYIIISNATEILEHLENGKIINVKVRKATFAASLTATNWAVTNLPAGVTKGAVTRLTDSTATIALSGNSSTEYGSDITNVTVTIQPAEFTTPPDAALTASTGVLLKNVTEVPGIYLHLLTYDNFSYNLGENKSYWINAEIGQASWNRSQIGYGKSATDTTGWTWADASWYENGEGNNKRIHLNIAIPAAKGTGVFYYNVRAKDQAADPWHYANDTIWTNTGTFAAKYKITVNPAAVAPYIIISNATEILEHQEDGKLINVKVRKATFKASLTATNWAVTNLPAGVTKGAVTRLTDSTATIALSGNSSAEYGSDITNVTVTVQPAEFTTPPDAALTASTGVLLKNVTEVPGIYLHLLTYDNFSYILGENKSYWINAEIGQASWNRSQIGYGKSATDTTGWTWADASWYENGEGNNKRIHLNIAIPAAKGTGVFYYNVRAKDQAADPWHYANDTIWTNTGTFAAKYKITVNPAAVAPYIIISNATEILEHQENGKLINVKVRNAKFVASLTAASWTLTNLPGGVTKGAVTRLTDSTATVALSGNSTAEYGNDITNVTLTILATEFVVAPDAALTANSGVVLKNVTPGIYLHLLTYDNFSYTLGENKSYWINAEIGQASWNRSQIGYGKSATDTTGWTWADASWYEDGEGNNKRIHYQISIPVLKGSGDFYYNVRAKDLATDPWHYGNDTIWTNTEVFSAKYKITVKPVSVSYKISGRVYYPFGTKKVSMDTVKIYLKNEAGVVLQTTKSDTGGLYSFTNIEAGKYIIDAMLVRATGGINPQDALLTNRYYIGLSQFKDSFFMSSGDVNNDGKILSTDAFAINRFYIGTINKFTAGAWLVEKGTVTVTDADVVYDFRVLCFGDVNGSFNPKMP